MHAVVTLQRKVNRESLLYTADPSLCWPATLMVSLIRWCIGLKCGEYGGNRNTFAPAAWIRSLILDDL